MRKILIMPVLASLVILTSCFPTYSAYNDQEIKPLISSQKAVTFAPGNPGQFKNHDFSAIDRLAVGTPHEYSTSMRKLIDYLCTDAKTDLDKTRAVFRWMAQNIEYDGKMYQFDDIQDMPPDIIFLQRKGVCWHYSVLFQRLMEMASVQAKIVLGKASGYPGDIISGKNNHAWNAVKIDGEWYLVDVTWSAGYLDEKYKFHYFFSDHFFLTDPREFIKSHYPEDPFWQLLEKPISEKTFIEMAKTN